MNPSFRAALGAAVLAAVLPLSAGPARPQGAAPGGAAPSVIGERYQDVLAITRQLDQNHAALRRNRENGTGLARRVETLKKSPSGVMRDVQLQDALKALRGAIAEERRLNNVGANLAFGLSTKRLELARYAGTEADRLTAEGERLVQGDDLEGARHRFEAAYDLLTLPVEVPPPASAFPPEKPDPKVDVRPRGDETPDELRTLALILRDGADRARFNADLWNGLLARLRAERANVAGLLALAPPPSAARADVRARLDSHIREVQDEIVSRRRAQGRLLAEAAFLDRKADLDELVMLKDAALNPQDGGPEGTP